MEVRGEGDYIPIATHHHQNDSCIKMGSDESHFKVSVGSDGERDGGRGPGSYSGGLKKVWSGVRVVFVWEYR